MPTGKLNLKWVAARITEKQLAELTELVKHRVDPRQAKMEKQRDKLTAALRKIDSEIAALTDGGKPKAKAKRPGRKPRKTRGKAAAGKSGGKAGAAEASDGADSTGPFVFLSGVPQTPKKRKPKQPPKMTRAIQREFQERDEAIRKQVMAEYESNKRAEAARDLMSKKAKVTTGSADSDAKRAKLLENLAKARAARAAKRAAEH